MNRPVSLRLSELSALKSSGNGYVMARCPFHKDRRPSFSVNTRNGWARCFACGAKTRVKLDRVVPSGIHRTVGATDGGSPGRMSETCETLRDYADWFSEQTTAIHENPIAREFVESRGLGAETCDRLGVRAYGQGTQTEIAFPYFDDDARLCYWKLRSIAQKRFRRAPAGGCSYLFNQIFLEELRNDEPPIIVEGEFDVVAWAEAGEFGVVSVPDGANSITRELLAPLGRFSAVLLSIDSDEAGRHLEKRLCDLLPGTRFRRIALQGGSR